MNIQEKSCLWDIDNIGSKEKLQYLLQINCVVFNTAPAYHKIAMQLKEEAVAQSGNVVLRKICLTRIGRKNKGEAA